MKIDRQPMPPLRGLNPLGTVFYKDVAPTALGHSVPMSHVDQQAEAQAVTTDAIIKKVFNAVPVP
jgi:hypothetical protein